MIWWNGSAGPAIKEQGDSQLAFPPQLLIWRLEDAPVAIRKIKKALLRNEKINRKNPAWKC